VRAVGDITTYTGYDGTSASTTAACDVPFPASTCYQDSATLPTVPFLEANATFARPTKASTSRPTATRSFTTEAPSPTAPGSRTDCLRYANYFSTGDAAVDTLVNSCASVARYNEVTVAQLLEWNKSLKAASCALLPRYTYCVRVEDGNSPLNSIGIRPSLTAEANLATVTSSTADEDDDASTLPTTSSPTSVPSPSKTSISPSKTSIVAPPAQTQPGIVAGCNKYVVQSGQQYCYDMAAANGITLDQLYKWNPALNGDCSGMYGGYAYCVGVSS
jgi:LysM repeat protein